MTLSVGRPQFWGIISCHRVQLCASAFSRSQLPASRSRSLPQTATMLDISLRPLKDKIFDPLCAAIPEAISPLQMTGLALLSGVCSCLAAAVALPQLAVSLWLCNRILDCLDGAVARRRNQASDLGGFLDLLSDFIIYSAIPICCALGLEPAVTPRVLQRRWLAVAIAESSFHVNNFILFFVAAVAERKRAEKSKKGGTVEDGEVKELTSVSMRPALIEGTESGIIFTLMLAIPTWTDGLCWALSAGVVVGIVQRTVWTIGALKG